MYDGYEGGVAGGSGVGDWFDGFPMFWNRSKQDSPHNSS